MILDKLLLNASTVDAKGIQLTNQAIAIQGEMIAWCGDSISLPKDYKSCAKEVIDCKNCLVTPGLIDCHTHLVHSGNRANEYKRRMDGASYEEIALHGGGIIASVQHLRNASEDELFIESLPRLQSMAAQGVTTVEIKSGYGLDLKNEVKMLKVARKLGEHLGVRVFTTFLGAHAVPKEFSGRAQSYIDYLCAEVMPAIANSGLADAVDVFCDSIAFSLKQAQQIFLCARNFGLPIKCHAEQLSNMGASELAAEYGALSCDHLEYLDDSGVDALSRSGTVAVILPGAYYFLQEIKKPPVAMLRESGVGIAIATDCNPGSSPTTSLRLMMSMACQLFGLSIAEAISGVTYQASRALGLQDYIGELRPGLKADLVCWSSTKDSADLCYQFGNTLPHKSMIAGEWRSFAVDYEVLPNE